ncbi:hypothetical protein [Psychrobacillus sp. FJAT-21963]|uniref:hypothetical protein n=1 Tax=Psychrobacillus sp. FJAT-21963 TaxID=1712028 RepID=UPI000700F0D6|nr:hypothetical protein [Psychrobacillus sp. FJAT-21963]KQL22104.1 hypothetical protein AN959_20350 [Psychrobacillus sp. FJAT-21963]
MDESKIEETILYIVVFILSISLIVLVFLMNFSLINIKIEGDIWGPLSTFIGALLGAGISGGIAIYIMNRDTTFRREERQEELNDNFKKSFELISMWSNSYLQTFNSLHNLVQANEGGKKNSLEIQLNAIKECMTRLDKINDDYIPQEVYKDFLDLKTYIDLIYNQYKAYTSTIEIRKHRDELVIVSENVAVKQWILDSYKDSKESFIDHLNVLQDYRNKIK